MANNATSAQIAVAEAAPTRNPMATPQRSAKPYFAPIMSAAICGAWRAPLASLVIPSPVGSKKAARLPELHETLVPPSAERTESAALELDEL
jgi:hypothetical protein